MLSFRIGHILAYNFTQFALLLSPLEIGRLGVSESLLKLSSTSKTPNLPGAKAKSYLATSSPNNHVNPVKKKSSTIFLCQTQIIGLLLIFRLPITSRCSFCCFRYLEIGRLGVWESCLKFSPKLQNSEPPSSESKEGICNWPFNHRNH